MAFHRPTRIPWIGCLLIRHSTMRPSLAVPKLSCNAPFAYLTHTSQCSTPIIFTVVANAMKCMFRQWFVSIIIEHYLDDLQHPGSVLDPLLKMCEDLGVLLA